MFDAIKKYFMKNPKKATCRECGKKFFFDASATRFLRETKETISLKKEFPVTDDNFPDKRWDIKMKDFIFLTEEPYDKLCHECDKKERNIIDNYDCGGSMCKNGCKSMMNFDEPCGHFKMEVKE